MADEKIYVGNGISKFDGDQVEFSVDLSNPGIKEHMFEYDGNQYIKLVVRTKRDGADEYGKTHWVRINTFKPEPQTKAAAEPVKEDSLPF